MRMRKSDREKYLHTAFNTPVDESYLYETKFVKREDINHPLLPRERMNDYTIYFIGCSPYVVHCMETVRRFIKKYGEDIECIVCKDHILDRTTLIENDRDLWWLTINGQTLNIYTRAQLLAILH